MSVSLLRFPVKTSRIALALAQGCRKSEPVFSDAPLKLQGLTPLAKGNVRLVFAYPGRSEMVVKVMRPGSPLDRNRRVGKWLQGMRRYDPYLVFLREIREFVCGSAATGVPLDFIHKIRGLVETDLGLGLVMDAAIGVDGRLAPTLARVIAEGRFAGTVEAAFESFAAKLLGSSLIVSDLHERNLVLTADRDGNEYFQMIDGLGSSSLIPFKKWSATINRRSKEKKIARLRKRLKRRLVAYHSGNPLP